MLYESEIFTWKMHTPCKSWKHYILHHNMQSYCTTILSFYSVIIKKYKKCQEGFVCSDLQKVIRSDARPCNIFSSMMPPMWRMTCSGAWWWCRTEFFSCTQFIVVTETVAPKLQLLSIYNIDISLWMNPLEIGWGFVASAQL